MKKREKKKKSKGRKENNGRSHQSRLSCYARDEITDLVVKGGAEEPFSRNHQGTLEVVDESDD